MNASEPQQNLISRRRVLTSLGIFAVVGAGAGRNITRAIAGKGQAAPEIVGRNPAGFQSTSWNDPRSWPAGRVPGDDEIAIIERPVVMEGMIRVAGVRIRPHGALVFSPNSDATLESLGNVVAEGQLVMRPANASVKHLLRFVDIDEASFSGGQHMQPSDSDVGLWVTGMGGLDARGAAKSPWLRLAGGVNAGATTLTLGSAPSGWVAGDRIVVVPTGQYDFDGFDERTIVAVNGSKVTVDEPLSHDHPAFMSGLTAEVANLTRNVVIEGTPAGRAHVHFHVKRSQDVRHIELRHLGPRQADGSGTTGVEGRYAFHMHHGGDATRGTIVEGVVAHHCGNFGFVPHESHGVTFRQCVAFDLGRAGFWWDFPDYEGNRNESNDLLWDRCLSARHWGDPNSQERGLSAFSLHAGTGTAAVGCVAVGVQGASSAAGFDWPSRTNQSPNSVWDFRDCVAHNNQFNGANVWQNTSRPHVIDTFTAYHNGKHGIELGAYSNPYRMRDSVLIANGGAHRNDPEYGAQLDQHANARHNTTTDTPAGYERTVFDTRGLTRTCIRTSRHVQPSGRSLEWIDCSFNGQYVLEIDERAGGQPAVLDFVRARLGPEAREMQPHDILVSRNASGTTVRVQHSNGSAWEMKANGSFHSIPKFYDA